MKIYHKPSGKTRRVIATFRHGGVLYYQLAQVIKSGGQTHYHVAAAECFARVGARAQ